MQSLGPQQSSWPWVHFSSLSHPNRIALVRRPGRGESQAGRSQLHFSEPKHRIKWVSTGKEQVGSQAPTQILPDGNQKFLPRNPKTPQVMTVHAIGQFFPPSAPRSSSESKERFKILAHRVPGGYMDCDISGDMSCLATLLTEESTFKLVGVCLEHVDIC